MKVQIAIVGGGLVGLAFANALRRLDIEFVLLDANPVPDLPLESLPSVNEHQLDSGVSARVSAITSRSKMFLEGLSAWQAIPESRIEMRK